MRPKLIFGNKSQFHLSLLVALSMMQRNGSLRRVFSVHLMSEESNSNTMWSFCIFQMVQYPILFCISSLVMLMVIRLFELTVTAQNPNTYGVLSRSKIGGEVVFLFTLLHFQVCLQFVKLS